MHPKFSNTAPGRQLIKATERFTRLLTRTKVCNEVAEGVYAFNEVSVIFCTKEGIAAEKYLSVGFGVMSE